MVKGGAPGGRWSHSETLPEVRGRRTLAPPHPQSLFLSQTPGKPLGKRAQEEKRRESSWMYLRADGR